MTDDQQHFIYGSLDLSRQTIRLFRFTDSSGSCGELVEFGLDELPIYRALSYMWGTQSDIVVIQINKKAFPVRRNLYSFLETYKPRFPNEWLWVDQVSHKHASCISVEQLRLDLLIYGQICINQKAITERNRQVRLMSTIYSQAKEVLIWLSSPDDVLNSDPCVCGVACQREHRGLDPHSFACRNCEELRCDRAVLHIPCPWDDILSQHPYWGRLWIIQELFLATQRTIWYGEQTFTWQQLRGHATRKSPASKVTYGADAYVIEKAFPLPVALGWYSGHACEDPRDKVYALQAILPLNHRLEIDYTKSSKAVFVDTVVFLLLAGERDYWGYLGSFANQMSVGTWLNLDKKLYEGIERVVIETRRRKGDFELELSGIVAAYLDGDTEIVKQWLAAKRHASGKTETAKKFVAAPPHASGNSELVDLLVRFDA